MKNEKGITLVELLAALAIMGIIVVAIMSVFSTGVNSSDRNASRQQLQQEANLIVEQIRTTYLENEKSDLIAEEFKVKIEGDELLVTSLEDENEKTLSNGYQYKLAKSTGTLEVFLDRTKTSHFYLEICSNDQCFEVQTSFSKLN